MSERAVLGIYECRGHFQVSIEVLDENDTGWGSRIYGPKFDGTGKPVLVFDLAEAEARAIRQVLDRVHPLDFDERPPT